MNKKLLLILVVLLSLCLLLVACVPADSDKDDDNGGGTVVPPEPEPVALDAPNDIKATAGVLTFSWNSNAGGYNVKIDGTEHNVTNQTELNALTLMLDAGTHTVAAQAVAKSASYLDSEWSSEVTVYVDTAPAGLEFVKIADNYYIRWNGTSMVVKRFEVTVDALQGGQWVAEQQFYVEDTAFTVTNLDVNSYRVRVRSYDDGVQFLASPYSQEFFYTVDDGGAVLTSNADNSGTVVWGSASPGQCIIPQSVTTIANDAFYGSKSLVVRLLGEMQLDATLFKDVKAVVVPDDLLETYTAQLKDYANKLYVESALTDDGLVIVKNTLVAYLGSASEVVVPSSVTAINKGVFADVTWVESLTLPFVGARQIDVADTNIGYIFGVTNNLVPSTLKKVVITDATRIFNGAFSNSRIKEITIPNTVTRMGVAFDGCNSLTTLTLPFIGLLKDNLYNSTFDYNFGGYEVPSGVVIDVVPRSLQNIILTNQTRLNNAAFFGLKQLVSVTLPNTLKYIDESAFMYCEGLTEINIPDGVETIESNAFYGCESLGSIEIPNGVKKIGDGALAAGKGLYKLSVAEGNSYYHSKDNCVIETATGKLIAGCSTSIIPSYIKSIANSAFRGVEELKEAIIPDGVTSIGNAAFFGCRNIETLSIPSTVKTIGEFAFAECYQAEGIVIPKGVTVIEMWAFQNCKGLVDVVLPDSIARIEEFAFGDCSEMVSITIPSSVSYIASDAFSSCRSLSDIYFAGSEAKWNTIAKNLDIPATTTVVFDYKG